MTGATVNIAEQDDGSTSTAYTVTPARTTPTETEEEILTRIGDPYGKLLWTLWGMHHLDNKDIKIPTMGALQDEA